MPPSPPFVRCDDCGSPVWAGPQRITVCRRCRRTLGPVCSETHACPTQAAPRAVALFDKENA